MPESLRIPFALLGLLFLGCGAIAWWRRRDRFTTVFLAFGLGGGLHWGGSIGSDSFVGEWSLFFFYLSISAIADAAILHLALIYPGGGRIPLAGRVALYSPAMLAAIVTLLVGVLPRETLEAIGGGILLFANLFTIAAGVTFIGRCFVLDRSSARAARLPLIATAMVLGSALAILGAAGVLPGQAEAWNLALAIIPISLMIALRTRD